MPEGKSIWRAEVGGSCSVQRGPGEPDVEDTLAPGGGREGREGLGWNVLGRMTDGAQGGCKERGRRGE